MIRRLATPVLVLIALAALSCSSSGGDPAMTQEKFGVRMAKMNLWREAMFRFRRAVEMNPEDAMAHSNLAVALEANGDFDGAAKAYREALRLDKSNEFIQKNYSRFVEFTTRDRRRQQRRPPASPAAAATAAAPESTPPSATPEQPSTPAAVTAGETPAAPPQTAEPVQADPAPTAAAPAETPAPNPAPPPTPPPQSNTPPGGQS